MQPGLPGESKRARTRTDEAKYSGGKNLATKELCLNRQQLSWLTADGTCHLILSKLHTHRVQSTGGGVEGKIPGPFPNCSFPPKTCK